MLASLEVEREGALAQLTPLHAEGAQAHLEPPRLPLLKQVGEVARHGSVETDAMRSI